MANKQSVLVVEDETLLLQAITKKLEISNFEVISCSGGKQALDYLEQTKKLPDAIWLDYYLKDFNGLAFVQKVKANPGWVNIPIITVSNSASPQKVHNMLALGVRKYVLKAEFRLEEIIAIVKQLINETKSIEPGQGQEQTKPPTDQSQSPQSSLKA